MKMKNFTKALVFMMPLSLFSTVLHAKCDVQEVIEMVEDDMSTKMIKDACDGDVDVPECSVYKVVRLARRKNSEDNIYEVCDDQSAEHEDDPISNPEQNSGLPRGSVIRACGCWGYVNFGATDRAPQCASGYGVAVSCNSYCPAGGVQWGIRCQ